MKKVFISKNVDIFRKILYNCVEVAKMKTRLTLQEKLRDLCDERKLTQQNVMDATGIPIATLSRIESDEDIRASYQDIAAYEPNERRLQTRRNEHQGKL